MLRLRFTKNNLPAKAGQQTVLGKHLNYGYAMCHYCLSQTLVPELCPLCGKKMVMFGLGSQRLEEEVARKFPAAQNRKNRQRFDAGKGLLSCPAGFRAWQN